MQKQVYPALLKPGFHDRNLDDLEKIFVEPFSLPDRRRFLLSQFQQFLERFNKLNLRCEIWIDGSFTSQKPEPDDIDLVIFYNPTEVNNLSADKQKELERLIANPLAKIDYSCDVYFVSGNDTKLRSYWRGWYSFDQKEQPKGVVRLFL